MVGRGMGVMGRDEDLKEITMVHYSRNLTFMKEL